MEDIVYVSAGDWNTMAITNNGELWGWGLNHAGELGNGNREKQLNPILIMEGVIAVSTSRGMYMTGHTMALKNDGSIWTWGENFYNQLGDNTITPRTVASRTIPTQVIIPDY
jgi:hypothetical protein